MKPYTIKTRGNSILSRMVEIFVLGQGWIVFVAVFALSCSGESEDKTCVEDGTCAQCEKSTECEDTGICNISDGQCVKADAIVYVDGAAGGDVDGCGAGLNAAACKTLVKGLELVRDSSGGKDALRIAPGTYDEDLPTIDFDVLIVGGTKEDTSIAVTSPNRPNVNVNGDITVLLERITLLHKAGSDNDGDGILCTGGANLSVMETSVNGHQGNGIDVRDCTLKVTSSSVNGNNDVGIFVTGGNVTITSSSVSENDDVGIENSGGNVTITSSSIDGNDGEGIGSTNGSVTVTSSSVNDNAGSGGFIAFGGSVTLEGCEIRNNDRGGVLLEESNFSITNTNFVRNGTSGAGGSPFGGIMIENTSAFGTQVFQFNTVFENMAATGASGVICDTATPATAESSIVYAGDWSCGWKTRSRWQLRMDLLEHRGWPNWDR